jgi:hypothetical protein
MTTQETVGHEVTKCTDHATVTSANGIQMIEYKALEHPLPGPYRLQLIQLGQGAMRYRTKGMKEAADDAMASINALDYAMRQDFGVLVKRVFIQPAKRL